MGDPLCTFGEPGRARLLFRVASPRRYVGLRVSWGGFAPTAPADVPAGLSRRRS